MKLIALLALTVLLPFSAAHADGPPSPAPEPDTSVSSPVNEAPAAADAVPVEEPAAPCEFGHLVGKKESEIDRSQFGDRPVRTLKPDQAVTMEYLNGRINLNVDDAGVITSVTCG